MTVEEGGVSSVAQEEGTHLYTNTGTIRFVLICAVIGQRNTMIFKYTVLIILQHATVKTSFLEYSSKNTRDP